MSNNNRAPVRLTILVCLLAATSLAASQEFARITTIAASTTGHDVFKDPQAVAVDLPSGVLFIADRGHHQIARVDPSGTVTIVAGSGKPGKAEGAGLAAQFKEPQGIAVDSIRRVIYIADTGNHLIRRVTFEGVVTTLAGSGRGEDRDGIGTDSSFKDPVGLALDPAGNLYVADSGNDKIRMITLSGNVTTFAGTGRPGYGDGPGAQALFKGPRGIAVSPLGIVYVADTHNHAIRKIANGIVSTLAGTTHGGSVDGAPNVAEFKEPSGIALDDAGNLWIADTLNHQIRRIGADGVTTTVAGDGKPGYVDGTDLLRAGFHEPTAITVAGAVFIADSKNNAIRIIIPALAAADFNPRSGSPNGGDTVRIFGSGFIPGRTEVTFGGVRAASIVYLSSTELTVITPAHTLGDAEVRVTTPAGSVTFTSAFRYLAPPTIDAFSPGQGGPGTTVAIIGRNFDPNADGNLVRFGGVIAAVISSSYMELIVTVPSSALTGPVTVTTEGGTAVSSTSFLIRTLSGITIDPTLAVLNVGATQQFTATATYSDGTHNDVTNLGIWSSSDATTVAINQTGAAVGVAAGIATIHLSHEGIVGTARVDVRSDGRPPDPATNAPPNDPTIPTSFVDSIAFLYSGPTAIQKDVVAGALVPRRLAVVRGRVVDGSGAPLSGARVSALDHAEGGVTLSRADGWYDLVVNGGGSVVVQFEKAGHIPVHRQVRVPWHDFVVADDAVLIPYDSLVTSIELDQLTSIAMARGSVTTDSDGTRRATLLFAPGTTASMHLPNGTTQPITRINVRATEQSVGKTGAMPADLPPQSGYTYCVELSVDEAEAAGAESIQFSQPISVYLENFLGFRVGSEVPAGYYDRKEAAWLASDNGRVIKVLAVDGGIATLDTDGDGVADDGSTLGITLAERQSLANLYPAEQTLWRVPITHFTSWDFNWSFFPPDDAKFPDVDGPTNNSSVEGQSCQAGSIIECESLVLGESLPISGTPFTLEFRSRSAEGYLDGRTIDIALSNAELPQSLKRIELRLEMAGRPNTFTFAPTSNLKQSYTWNLKDAYNRVTYADRSLGVRISYIYDAVYRAPGTGGKAFGSAGDIEVTDVEMRREAILTQEFRVLLHGARPDQGLGGWTLSPVHSYDAARGQLRLGTGTNLDMASRGFEGKPLSWATGNQVGLVRTGADGSVYSFRPNGFDAVKRMSAEGVVTAVAGGGSTPPANDVPALSAALSLKDLAILPNGDLILLDGQLQTIFRSHQGTLRKLASGASVQTLSVAADQSIWYTDNGSLMRVDLGGNVTTVAAAEPTKNYYGVRVGADGVPYVLIALGNPVFGNLFYSIHRWPSREKIVNALPYEWGADSDGRFYYLVQGQSTFQPHGIQVIEPNGTQHPLGLAGPFGTAASFALLPGGQVVYGELAGASSNCGAGSLGRCLMIAGIPLGVVAANVLMAPPSGAEAYRFSLNGRLLETRSTLTNTLLARISYAPTTGFPIAIQDADGLVTNIERSRDGTAIIAPNGDRTELEFDDAGRLIAVTDPAGSHRLGYTEDGLLRTFRNPRGKTTTYTYDERGRLSRSEDAVGGGKALVFTRGDGTDTVRLTTRGGLVWQYDVKKKDDGSNQRRTVDPPGLVTSTTTTPTITTRLLPDGTSVRITQGSDPRWKAMVPVTSNVLLTLPSGREISIDRTRSVTPAVPSDPLTFTTLTDRVTVAGRSYTATYTASDRRQRVTSPAGRVFSRTFDVLGRVTQIAPAGVLPLTFTYDSRGRVATIAQGLRVYTAAWSDRDELASLADATGRTTSFEYDASGMLIAQTLPGNRTITFGHDENGNTTSLTPPGRPAHTFTFDDVDLPTNYAAPGSSASMRYEFNLDRDLSLITLPDGRSLAFAYSSGRLSRVTADDRGVVFGYNTSGELQSISDSKGPSLQYTWDGDLPTGVGWTGSVAGSVSWDYDSMLRLSTERVNGSAISFGYDNDSLLMAAGALTIQRDGTSGRLTGTTLSSITDSYSYNAFGEVAGYTASYLGVPLLAFNYTRDAAGRITSNGVQRFEYDAAGRLARVTVDSTPVAEYDYDANGNRTAHRYVSGSAAATHDEQDRLLTYGDTTYSYTAAGDLKSRTVAGETTTLNYDELGNLRRVEMSGRTIEYVIDGQNRRVGKKVDNTLVQGLLYGDQLRIIAELDGTNRVVSRFVYGSRSNVPDYMIKAGVTYRILSDHLGSPRLVVNVTDGSVVQSMTRDEFGRVLSDSAPGFQPFGFAGGLNDPDTGLVRFGARDYDPHVGRFVSKDPILFGGGSANLYAYSFNDPVNFSDPTGLITIPGFGWVDVGEHAGSAALGTYADMLTDPDAAWSEQAGAAVGGLFSALWTPCTSDKTFTTLSAAYTVNAYVGRSFWQYYPANNPAYQSRWLTRGSGWRPPYSPGPQAVEKLALPPYNPATGVRQMPSSWRQFVGGPGTVPPAYGQPGGGIQYLANGWPR